MTADGRPDREDSHPNSIGHDRAGHPVLNATDTPQGEEADIRASRPLCIIRTQIHGELEPTLSAAIAQNRSYEDNGWSGP